jgi:hypothetical protein
MTTTLPPSQWVKAFICEQSYLADEGHHAVAAGRRVSGGAIWWLTEALSASESCTHASYPDPERPWDENMKNAGASEGQSASELISKRIAELGDWRGKTLGRMRKLIKEADPDVVEEWKWMGTPIWSHDGIICTGESYKKVVKLTFAKGASLKDPAHLFNSSLDGNVRRAIDIPEGQEVDASAFKALVRQAVALNSSSKPSTKRSTKPSTTPSTKPKKSR